jgi:sec-independent protein translocase protein TatA
MGLSWQHILLLMIVALLLFGGRGKISGLMGDFASGIKAFKKGLADDDSEKAEVAKSESAKIDHQPAQSGGATPEPAKKMDQPAQPAA